MGNSFAEDIISILEDLIPKTWRNEIKDQFKKDSSNIPQNNDILFETKKTVSVDHRVKDINKILSKGVFSIIINDDIDVLKKFKKKYEK